MGECGAASDPSREFVPEEEACNRSNTMAGVTDSVLELLVVPEA
jgi:hypothetical protein